MVLADVSSAGRDSDSGEAYRNGNVMYEVGLALACRQSSEVLLIRDDKDPFLFDVSTIPHMHVDFTDVESAKRTLIAALSDRLGEQKHINDARVQLAVASLSPDEAQLLKQMTESGNGLEWARPSGTMRDVMISISKPLPGLLAKQLIKCAAVVQQGHLGYELTPLGEVVAGIISTAFTPGQAITQSNDHKQINP